MKKTKVLLINPGRESISVKPGSASWIAPQWLALLSAFTPKNVDLLIHDELTRGPLDIRKIPKDLSLVGIGGLTTSRTRAQILSKRFRERGTPVIGGGMDVTGRFFDGDYQPEEKVALLNDYSAIAVGRLTEDLWQEVINDAVTGSIEGQVYRFQGGNNWQWKVPDHQIFDPKHYLFPAVRVTDGCPYRCPWCVVGLATDGQVCCKPGEIIRKELKVLPSHAVTLVSDDSFGVNKDHTRKIALPELKRSGRKWATELTIRNFLDLAKEMAKAGCVAVYFGIENIRAKASAKCLSIKEVEKSISLARKLRIIATGSFILDWTGKEIKEDIRKTVDWANRWLEAAQFSLIVPVPGSPYRKTLFEKGAKRKIINFDPEKYDGSTPLLSHDKLTTSELKMAISEAYHRFYSKGQILRKAARPHVLYHIADVWKIFNQVRKSIRDWNWD